MKSLFDAINSIISISVESKKMDLLQFQLKCQRVNMLQTRVLTLEIFYKKLLLNNKIKSAKQKLKI